MAKIWQCVIRQASFGQAIQNTMWLNQDTDILLPDQTLADNIGLQIATSWAPHVTNDMSFVDLYFSDTTTSGPGITMVPSNFPLIGSLTGQVIPLQACALLTMRAAPPGYPIQNRKYISGATEDQVSNGLFSTAVTNDLLNIRDVFDNNYVDGTGNIWISGLSSSSPRNFKPSNGASVSREVYTQRRRRRRL